VSCWPSRQARQKIQTGEKRMPTKNQIELALTAVLTHLQQSGEDLHSLADTAITMMHQKKMHIAEDSVRERGGATDELLDLVERIAGPRCRLSQEPEGNIEDF